MATGKESAFDKLPTLAKAGLGVVVVLALGAIYYFAMHMSLVEEIQTEEQRQRTLENDYQAAQARQQEYLKLRQELSRREVIDRHNLRILPEKAEIPAFLQDLHRLAELSGLNIQLVEPRPEEAETLYIRIPVTLSLSGKFHHLAKFFYNASRLERAINMENISLTQPKATDEAVMLRVDVLATTFRRPGLNEGKAQAQAAQAAAPETRAGNQGAKK